MTVRTITLTYNSTSRTLTASSDTIGTTGDVSSSRFAYTPATGDIADIVFIAPMSYLQSGRLDNPFVRIGSDNYAVIPGAILSRLKDDDVDIYLKLTHTDGTVETSSKLTMKVVTIGNTPTESDSTGALMIRGSSWEWQALTTYDLGAVASKGNYVYVSLAAGNIGHDPSSTTGYWIAVTGSQGPQGQPGPQGPVGPAGPQGEPFNIVKIYNSYQAMQDDYNNPDIDVGDMVLISSNVEDPYNSCIYIKGESAWQFVTDMSGAQGVQGPKGDPFSIYATYSSISAMESDHASVTVGKHVAISSSDTDNGKLFIRENVTSPVSPSTAHFRFVISMAGPQGQQGQPGSQGPQGPAGTGVPTGGQTDYILAKNSGTDFDFKWVAQGSAPVTSVNGKQGVVELDSDDIEEGVSNHYLTDAEKNKLLLIEDGAQVNVQSDWNQTDSDEDDFIKNKPAIPSALSSLSDDSTHRLVTDTEKNTWNAKQSALTFDDAPTSGSNNPVKSGGIYTAIANAIANAVHWKGTCTAAELAQKTGMVAGDMWNISTSFISGDETYPPGTNVVWSGTAWDPLVGVMSGFVPVTRTVNTKPLSSNVTLGADDLAEGSTNKFMTSAERTKLGGIETGAEVNHIDTVKVNGTALVPTAKAVDVTVPVSGTDFLSPSSIASTYVAQTWCTLQTTAPTASIGDGGIHIVILSTEPDTKYSGYIYMIQESS